MPKRKPMPRSTRKVRGARVRKRPPVRRRPARRGGKVKASDVLGGISAAALGASTLGFDAPFTLPIAGLAGIASGIARLFGAGGITQQQAQVLRRAERQGLVIGRKPMRRKQRRRRK